MGTKQSAVARIEASEPGTISLRRFVEFAIACGYVPLDIVLVPIAEVEKYARLDPSASRTHDAFAFWQRDPLLVPQ